MANDNNNINELVADDDPTAELEVPSFAAHHSSPSESDSPTYDALSDNGPVEGSGVTVSELQSNLRSRTKTIGKLQFDIEQLHAKRLGLEAEIRAREGQSDQLNDELRVSHENVSRKEKLLKKRDRRIKSLKSEIRQRDKDFRHLQAEVAELQAETRRAVESEPLQEALDRPANMELLQANIQQKIDRTESYADELRQKTQDLLESNDGLTRELSSLKSLLSERTQSNNELSAELESTKTVVDELQGMLDSVQSSHDEEIRILRFELGSAQETVVESEDLSSQLASELVDAKGFKDELERMLGEVEEKSAESISSLEKDVKKLKRAAESHEQKLVTKSEAISLLLAELAKKSEQIESIGEIEDVIQDIDVRMSERSAGSEKDSPHASSDRVTRFLIGSVDDQVLRFPLFKDRLTVGRTKDNDIQLDAAYISRRHAVIQTDDDKTRIIDWGSKNGVHVNGAKTTEHFLSHGDVVSIGNARFRYEERKMREN